jgi:hypothetical protein
MQGGIEGGREGKGQGRRRSREERKVGGGGRERIEDRMDRRGARTPAQPANTKGNSK